MMMVISFFLGMLRYKLFNIKIILTEIVSVIIVISLLIEIFYVKSYSELFLKTIVLIIITCFSYILIKSVTKEVSQRERIEFLAADLQKANDRLTDLDKQKSEFVSFATHQLRAPLTAMKGYASLILEGDLGAISEDVKNAIVRIYESSNTLTSIVDDYLNISRIELGTMKYSFEKIDLRDLVNDVIGELKPNIEKSKVKFDFDYDKTKKYMVKVDPNKFKQIIANLVDNSIKYTPQGEVKVNLALVSGKILFSVKDNGIGIAPEVLPKLFMKFSRATNGSRQNIHGTGLGLFVAKEIVSAHRGRIWAESVGEGKGSSFFVEVDEEI
jgi:signal transduction histidine kinase